MLPDHLCEGGGLGREGHTVDIEHAQAHQAHSRHIHGRHVAGDGLCEKVHAALCHCESREGDDLG